MYVLRMLEPERFLVVPDKEPDALTLNRLKQVAKIVEARIGYVIEAGDVSFIDALDVKTLVLKVDAFAIIPHTDPSGGGIILDGTDRFLELGNIASGGSQVNVPNRVQPE